MLTFKISQKTDAETASVESGTVRTLRCISPSFVDAAIAAHLKVGYSPPQHYIILTYQEIVPYIHPPSRVHMIILNGLYELFAGSGILASVSGAMMNYNVRGWYRLQRRFLLFWCPCAPFASPNNITVTCEQADHVLKTTPVCGYSLVTPIAKNIMEVRSRTETLPMSIDTDSSLQENQHL